eukprot:gene7070-793_t
MSEDSKEDVKHIELVIKFQDGGGEIKFKVKKTVKMSKIFKAFAAKKNIDLTNCRFTFDGEAIEDDATPLSLELEQGDEIDAFTSQTGGGAGSAGNRSGKSWWC